MPTVRMAPVIPLEEWEIRSGKVYALCPFCGQRQVIENEIVDGFTEGMIICRMPNCTFLDWVRLEGWDSD